MLTLLLGCTSPTTGPAPLPVPPVTPEAPPVAPVAATPAVVNERQGGWPLRAWKPLPTDARGALPAGATVLDVEVAPWGDQAVAVVRDPAGGTRLWRWTFADDPTPVDTWVDRTPRDVAYSPLTGALYVVSEGRSAGEPIGDWRIDRCTVAETRLACEGEVYTSTAPLSALTPAAVRWDGRERLFFARAWAPDQWQVLSARADGSAVYELTSPGTELSELTDPGLRTADPENPDFEVPALVTVPSGVPLSVHPVTGALLWRDDAGKVRRRDYLANWLNDRPVSGSGYPTRWHPQGWYRLESADGKPGIDLVEPDGTRLPLHADTSFLLPPVASGDGRSLVAAVDAGGHPELRVLPIAAPLAGVRFLTCRADDKGATLPLLKAPVRAQLATKGLAEQPARGRQLYEVYEAISYGELCTPVFASVDGLLEVLHTGFQAVFLTTERDVSLPRLRTFAETLSRSARAKGLERVGDVADVTRQVLAGDYTHPEAKLILAGATAASALHGHEVAFGDFEPRGPYTRSEELKHYFRAFKYLNELELDERARGTLLADGELVAAWRAWTDAQAEMTPPSRHQGFLEASHTQPAWVEAECLPERVRQRPIQVYPLSWGVDSEILERTVEHQKVPPQCSVKDRQAVNGLELLAGLGSPWARALLAPEEAAYPQLGPALDALAGRFGGGATGEGVPGAWLRVIQRLAKADHVPPGVDPTLWRGRLMETALATWTSYRYTTVLVNEGTAAEMGGGFIGFEELTAEPPTGVVDPVPEVWDALAETVDRVAKVSEATQLPDSVPETLHEVAVDARSFGDMARRQLRGEPLRGEEYDRIQDYARSVEHPYLLLKSAVSPDEALTAADPVARIVDVHTWVDRRVDPPVTHIWHPATGGPRFLYVLGQDRGITIPATGAVYSWYAVEDTSLWTDERWRASLEKATPPPWVPVQGGALVK